MKKMINIDFKIINIFPLGIKVTNQNYEMEIRNISNFILQKTFVLIHLTIYLNLHYHLCLFLLTRFESETSELKQVRESSVITAKTVT